MNTPKVTRTGKPLAAGTSEEEPGVKTERARERTREDDDFIPVIVKRNDEVVRHPDDTIEYAIEEGLEQINRPFVSLALSSVAAGLILSFTAMAVAVMATLVSGYDNPLVFRLATALVYPLGFIICIMSGTQLFTEHTAVAVYPVLDRRAGHGQLLRLWSVVIAGNLAGAVASAWLLRAAEPVIGAEKGYLIIAEHLLSFDTLPLLFSALLAGWLMALGSWLSLTTPPNISQMACIYIVTFLIGFGGLHHSIAGAVEVFTAFLFSDHISLSQTGGFLGIAICGNTIGGSIFVALLNYGHIRKTQEIDQDPES
jgi:formate/nitrite transporter FocA (FNT family)